MNDPDQKAITRRGFLTSAAAMGTGLALSPRAFGRSASGSDTDINVALLGAGTQGQTLMNCCLNIPGIHVKAICDIWTAYNQQRASQTLKQCDHNHNAYADYRQMLEKESDLHAVIIATPDFWHAEQTVACLKAGLHVYCEAPMSNTLRGARKMVRAARETRRLLQIGHQRRSNPPYVHCCENLVKEVKLLGRITVVNGQWNQPVHPDRGWPKRAPIDEATLAKYGYQSMHQFRNWQSYKNLSAGPLAALGSHQIDVFNWFLEATPNLVMASGGTDYYDQNTHEWHDTVMLIYEYQTRRGTVRAFYERITTNGNYGAFEKFLGDQGTLIISEAAGQASVYREPAAPDWGRWVRMGFLIQHGKQPKTRPGTALDVRETVEPLRYNLPIKFDQPNHKPHLENFFETVRGKAKLTCPGEIAYQTAVAVSRVEEAIESEQKLHFSPDEFEA